MVPGPLLGPSQAEGQLLSLTSPPGVYLTPEDSLIEERATPEDANEDYGVS